MIEKYSEEYRKFRTLRNELEMNWPATEDNLESRIRRVYHLMRDKEINESIYIELMKHIVDRGTKGPETHGTGMWFDEWCHKER